MNRLFRIAFFDFPSGNLKSKIQNPKWVVIFAIALTFAFGGAMATAQQPMKIARIGYLSSGTPASESARSEAIRLALREIGYVEGAEYRYRVPLWTREA